MKLRRAMAVAAATAVIAPAAFLAADSAPGTVPPAEPEDGKSPADIKPQGGAKALSAAANGSLAETGSNSVPPAVGMAAGLAVAVGGGVVFALRRREGDAVA